MSHIDYFYFKIIGFKIPSTKVDIHLFYLVMFMWKILNHYDFQYYVDSLCKNCWDVNQIEILKFQKQNMFISIKKKLSHVDFYKFDFFKF
jgi:hypothetical protein